jgi:CBS domain-containing protein
MQLIATDICSNNSVTLEVNETLYSARNILIKYNISRVIILKDKESKKPVGIITEKDIVRFLYAEFPRRGLDEIRVGEIIANQRLITVKENTNISVCATLMLNSSTSSLVVTKDNGNGSILSGIVTKSDLLDA